MSIGLLLEGGGMRGLYTAGVLDIFLDNNIAVDGIVGVSAGVLFGVNYVSKQRGRTLRYNLAYAKDPRYMGMQCLIKTGNIVSKDFAYYELPFTLDIFDEEAYEKANIPFYATITNVETGQPEYVRLDNVLDQMELMRATSALPFVSKMVELDGNKYLDGGLSDSIPIDKLMQLGYDKIIVVLTRVKEYRKTKANPLLTKLVYRKYPNLVTTILNRYKGYNASVEKIFDMESKKEIFVIRPSRLVDVKRIERNPDKLQEMYDLGVGDCKACMEELKRYIG